MTTFPTNPDVIVVGAGAAGLSAAKALQVKGFDVVVLEADAHVGGRCITDTSTFATPFDRGGSWLHCGPINPLVPVAEQMGEDLDKARWVCNRVHTGGASLTGAEVGDYRQYHERMWEEIRKAGKLTTDASVASALPSSPWKDTAKHWVAQMQGGDAEFVSVADVSQFSDADGDWLVTGGLGAFVKRLHADVTVHLNCPVTKVDYSSAGVSAVTPQGTISAKCIVLTVSTGVLAAETIEFSPALPEAKTSAIHQLPMGLLNKVGLEFDPDWTGARQGEMADYTSGGDGFCTLLFGFYNTPLAVGFLAGRFADRMENEGAGTEFCLQALRDIFGNDVVKHVRKTSETGWRANPYTLGSYSYASPSGAGARAKLAEPIDGKVYFAGEATIPTAYATVHGAYQSGLNVAGHIASALR